MNFLLFNLTIYVVVVWYCTIYIQLYYIWLLYIILSIYNSIYSYYHIILSLCIYYGKIYTIHRSYIKWIKFGHKNKICVCVYRKYVKLHKALTYATITIHIYRKIYIHVKIEFYKWWIIYNLFAYTIIFYIYIPYYLQIYTPLAEK